MFFSYTVYMGMDGEEIDDISVHDDEEAAVNCAEGSDEIVFEGTIIQETEDDTYEEIVLPSDAEWL